VAALSHPNIVALYDVGRVDGVSFVVIELLRGATLRTRLAEGALAPATAVDHALQLAQGLVAAHARGLIHRDLKPENVFVTEDGQVKILDFGLARFETEVVAGGVDEAAVTVANPTIAGTVLGTPGYMAPEQVLGQASDHRSDLFALGAVLYEMLSGRRAFDGPTLADIQGAVLQKEPPPLATGSGADASLTGLVRKCLSKDREQRFQSARDLVQGLQTVFTTHPTTETGPSIAVLPFVDMSQGKDQDYFCEGMAEEILTALSEVSGLHVAARTSAFQFRGTHQDIRQIGQALGVSHVLEGSVRTAGTRLRVTAQLIKAADGYRVWSERYDREMEDVFTIQDEIARSVSHALAMRLGAPAGGIARKHSDDLEAYHLYLKGRHERYTTRNFPAALRYFEEAIDRDPRYALARAGIAETCILLGNTGIVRPRVTFARAETELEYARALAGETVELLTVECCLRAFGRWDRAGAVEVGRRAMALGPDFIFARTWLSLTLSAQGHFDEALAMARSAVPIDPLSPLAWVMAGWALSAGRRFEEAQGPLRRALEIAPRNTLAMWNLGVALVGSGQHDEALATFTKAHQVEPEASLILGMLAWSKVLVGREDEARRDLATLDDWAKHRHVPRYTIAWTLAALGDVETALAEYERSVEERDAFLSYPLFPGNDPLRGEPRFRAALERMGLGWAVSA
jgi:serine/threonine-protein kinase